MSTPAAWDDVRRRLRDLLTDLSQDEFVIVGEPSPEPGPPRGLLRRRPEPPPRRYVQFRDDGEWLYGECVGAALFGGDWEIGDEQHERLRAMGWLAPGDPDPSGTQPPYPNYWALRPRAEAGQMADQGVDALAELGADPATLEWQRDR